MSGKRTLEIFTKTTITVDTSGAFDDDVRLLEKLRLEPAVLVPTFAFVGDVGTYSIESAEVEFIEAEEAGRD